MIAAGFGSSLGVVPLANQPSSVATATGNTPDRLPATLRDASAQNAVTATPVSSLVPGAVAAIGQTDQAGDSTAEDQPTPDNPQDLTPEEEARVAELKRIDAEVRRHEQAHMNAGGRYAGQASYTYETGPDGGRYAVAGEVPIDTAPVPDNPEATIDKMEVVIRAALAPAEPSAQDLRVAAGARQTIAASRAELRAEQREEFQAQLAGDDDAEAGGLDPNTARGADANDVANQVVAGSGGREALGANDPQSGVAGLVSSVYSTVGSLRDGGDQQLKSFAV
ncbi:MAG: putative metalloprotease CJM1_0395 family protein [Pseudomonadota bacterium]